MRTISEKELLGIIHNRHKKKKLELKEVIIENLDLSALDLNNIDFTFSNFVNTKLENVNFENSILNNTSFSSCTLNSSSFKNASLNSTDLRFCNLSNSNIEGADLFGANLQGALLDGIIYNDETKYFKLYCPESGPFLGYKKCFNFRMVQLLIPKDAKRSSATTNECRCDKAKVLTIKSIDNKTYYKEARSYVDENFIYKSGEFAIASGFNEDRFAESTTGIHFFMTREEALGYL